MFNLNFEFHYPYLLLLFLLLVPLFIWDLRKAKREGVKVPTTQEVKKSAWGEKVEFLLKYTKYLVLSLLILALARPRTFTISEDRDDSKGIDIILAVDVSLSMLSKDLEPDRLQALQEIATRFVQERPGDRIGLVTYSGEAISKVPVTSDHKIVVDEIKNIDPIELQPGTAIGEGLSVAASHLRHSKTKSKVIILMTDGVNTIENSLSPLVAADLAQSLGIKVYTIGIGTNGYALMPTSINIFGELVFTEAEVKIDEPTLLDIARKTGGKYFRATSNSALEEVYSEINQLEKSELSSTKLYNYKEHYKILLFLVLGLILLEALVRWVVFKTIR